jgi:hypothetical protein
VYRLGLVPGPRDVAAELLLCLPYSRPARSCVFVENHIRLDTPTQLFLFRSSETPVVSGYTPPFCTPQTSDVA